jgi:hypothetical protein
LINRLPRADRYRQVGRPRDEGCGVGAPRQRGRTGPADTLDVTRKGVETVEAISWVAAANPPRVDAATSTSANPSSATAREATLVARPGVLLLASGLTVAAVIGKMACAVAVGRGIDRWAVVLGMLPRGEVQLVYATLGTGLLLSGRSNCCRGANNDVGGSSTAEDPFAQRLRSLAAITAHRLDRHHGISPTSSAARARLPSNSIRAQPATD